MEQQQYKNHIRFYTPHHFVFYPLLLAGLIVSLWQAFSRPGQGPEWLFISLLLVLTGWLSFMLRQHYALGNQNRIVRLEMRFRYYVLTGKRLELLEGQLSFGQIAALRFASDEELPALLERTLQERLSPDVIKKSIRNWTPDLMRV
jgi:hypothetical protein